MNPPPGAEASERAGLIAKQADVVAALTLEVLKGTSRFKLLCDVKMIHIQGVFLTGTPLKS